MTNLAIQSADVEEGTPVVDDGLPPFPDGPIMKHFLEHLGVLRFECPHDLKPMENEPRPFSLGAGVYSCINGHRWERYLGEWQGHRVWLWRETVSDEESAESELAHAWADYQDTVREAMVAISEEIKRVATEHAAHVVQRDQAFDAVETAISDVRAPLKAPVPAEVEAAS